MNLVRSIFRGAIGMRADAGGTPAPWDDHWYERGSSHSSSAGMRVSPETSKRLTTVMACVSARGKAIAILPFKVRKDLAGGGSMVVPNHPWYRILATRPNEFQTPYDFKFMMNGHVDLRGNAFAEKIFDDRGMPQQLLPMHPDRITVEILRGSGRLVYRYNDPLTNQTRTLVREEVFHLRDWSDNGWVGQSRVSMMVDSLGLALARQDFIARWLKNDARTGLIFSGGKWLTVQDKEKWIEDMRSSGTGANRGRPMWTPDGMTAVQLGVKPVDAELLEGHKASAVEICTGFGILPHLVGVDAGKSATYASVEQFNIMHAQQCVHPMVIMWEQAIQRDLIDDDRFYVKASMASLLRGDNATRFAGYAVAIQNSWMCPDDVRELEDLNPIPDGAGKVFWRSANLLPLKQLTNPSQTPSGGGEGDEGGAADDAGTDGAGGDAGARVAATVGRLQLLAASTADRCVRKEVAAVRRMIAQDAGAFEVTEFYAEHTRWTVEAFHMDATSALNVKIACDDRAQHLSMLLGDEDDEFHAAAQVWIETIAATEPLKLANLAVKGIQ